MTGSAGPPGLKRAIAELLPHLWPKDARELRVRVVLAFVFLLLAKLINVAVPFFYKAVVDDLSLPEGSLLVLPLAALLAYGGARFGAALFAEARDAVFAKVAERAGRKVSLSVFQHLFQMSLRYHLERRTGELARAIDRGVKAVSFMLGTMLFSVFPTLFEFALVIGILLVEYDWPFALIIFVTITVYAAFTIFATEWRTQFRRIMNEHDNAVSAQAVDSLLNYETVKTFTNEGYERDRFDRTLHAYERAATKSDVTLAVLNFGQGTIIAIGITIIMIVAAQGVVAGTLTVGDLVLVNAFLLQLYQPLNALGFVYRQLKQAIADLEHLAGLLALRPEVADRPDARPLALNGADVRFDRVGFGYDQRRPVLHDLSFTIPAGHTLAVVGSSGAGKSTLVRLLFRFYDVDAGAITIDGQDLRDVSQTSLARRDRPGAAGHRAVQRYDRRQHRLRPAGRGAGRDRGRGARGPDPRLHHDPARSLRDDGRRARPEALGRREAAGRDRAHGAEGPADPDLRRGDLRARQPHRAHDPGRAAPPVVRPHHADHRAPALDRGRRRPDPGARARPCGRAGPPRAAAGAPRHLRPDVGAPAGSACRLSPRRSASVPAAAS